MKKYLVFILVAFLAVGQARAQLVLPGSGSGGGAGTVTSVAAGCGATTGGSPITTSGTVAAQITASAQTGTNYAFQSSDCGKQINLSNASAQTPTLPTGQSAGWFVEACNQGAGTQTITPGSGTIGGGSSYVLGSGSAGAPSCAGIVFDGTNFQVDPGFNSIIPPVTGTVSTQSGTTYTFANTDCGTTVRFTSASAVTATIPSTLPVGCVIAAEQQNTAKVSVNGSAVTPATLHSAHSYTGTSGQWAMINIVMESSGVAVLTGDGS